MNRASWITATVQRGFTLVELMVALLLTAMVMALLFGGLRVTSRSWEAADSSQQQISEQYQLQQLLRRLISQAQQLRIRDSQNVLQEAFHGESDQLIFVAPRYIGSSDDTLLWYRLFLSPATADRPQALMVETRPFQEKEPVDWARLFDEQSGETSDGEPMPPPKQHLLRLTGDARLSFSYRYNDVGQPVKTESEWIGQTTLPLRVDLSLETRPGWERQPLMPARIAPLLSSWQAFTVALQEYNYAVRTD